MSIYVYIKSLKLVCYAYVCVCVYIYIYTASLPHSIYTYDVFFMHVVADADDFFVLSLLSTACTVS
jgi:hypothetical protein